MLDNYSQTAKGKAEFAAKPGKLPPGLKTLLGLVSDKATIADLKIKLPQVPLDKLRAALDSLVADGLPDEPGRRRRTLPDCDGRVRSVEEGGI